MLNQKQKQDVFDAYSIMSGVAATRDDAFCDVYTFRRYAEVQYGIWYPRGSSRGDNALLFSVRVYADGRIVFEWYEETDGYNHSRRCKTVTEAISLFYKEVKK